MRKVMLVAFLATLSIMVTGCTKQPELGAKEPVLKFSIPAKEMKIYVDNSMDIAKQENIVDTYVKALNNVDGFKVEITPGYIGKTDWSLLKFNQKLPVQEDGREYIYDLNANYPSFNYYQNINTFNHVFSDKVKLADENHGIFVDTAKYYENKKYTAKKLDAKSFEIVGFDSEKEALDIYIHLLRCAREYVLNNPLKKYIAKMPEARWPLDIFYHGTGLRFDGEALEKEGRLIIIPRILDFSMKDNLVTLLKHEGFSVVDSPKDANLVILVHNLLLEPKKNAASGMRSIADMFKDNKIDIPHEKFAKVSSFTKTGADFMQSGHTNAGYAGLALGALSLLDTSGYKHMYDVQLVSYYENGKNIFNSIEKHIVTVNDKRGRAVIPYVSDLLNYEIASNIIKGIHSAR